MNNIEFYHPAMALQFLEGYVCTKCSNNGGIQDDALVINDHDVCLSAACPVSKLRKIVGFRANLRYTYPTGTDKIVPE